ncbi:uncharacterized protein LOC118189700 [Stegodyphus dumicola]|uniref:uncharacterized protein LOC118189700 n=1 Tax=Stegodyphus dumicola TaxID=202533 RepID=UPI0015B08942|nr:uncharacterized protein LOC118189700 [Stegodyphus dumicola]
MESKLLSVKNGEDGSEESDEPTYESKENKKGFMEALTDLLQKLDETDISSFLNYLDSHSTSRVEKIHSLLEHKDEVVSRIGPQTEIARRVLQQLEQRHVTEYNRFLRQVQKWKPLRLKLLTSLREAADIIDRDCKLTTVARLSSTTIDIVGSVFGLFLNSESKWKSEVFKAASISGAFGLFFTVLEVQRTHSKLTEILSCIEEDKIAFKPIASWLRDSEELDAAIQSLFPYGIDKSLVREIHYSAAKLDGYLKFFKAGLLSNVRKNRNLIKDVDFLNSLKLFAESEVASIWWDSVFFRNDPIQLDFARMITQFEFGQASGIIMQSIPALPLEQQRLGSLPVIGRIGLNLLTVIETFRDLRQGAKSKYAYALRKIMTEMQNEFDSITNLVLHLKPRRQD